MQDAIFLTTDLLFGSRAQLSGSSIGRGVKVVGNISQLSSAIGEMPDMAETRLLLLVDLECPFANLPEIKRALANLAPEPHLVGFAGHVRAELLESAREHGFQTVLTRGQFNEQMQELLEQD